MHYPIRFYDVLSALLVMTEMGLVRDARCADALDLLECKRLADGMFAVEYTNVKRTDGIESRGTYADFGPLSKRKGGPDLAALFWRPVALRYWAYASARSSEPPGSTTAKTIISIRLAQVFMT